MKIILFMLSLCVPSISDAQTDPISIHGVDWSMSTEEQLRSLERKNLKCINEPGWTVWLASPESIREAEKTDSILCFESDNPRATHENLSRYWKAWVQICSRKVNGYTSQECWEYKDFIDLRDAALRATIRVDDAIRFECGMVGTCGFEPQDVVTELQIRLIPRPFALPTEDSYVMCAEGEYGDAICVHGHSKAIWLLRRPIREQMEF